MDDSVIATELKQLIKRVGGQENAKTVLQAALQLPTALYVAEGRGTSISGMSATEKVKVMRMLEAL
jgi:hypothetical protein